MLQYLLEHPTLLAALVAAAASLLGAILTARLTLQTAKRRAATDFELAQRRAAVDERLKKLEGELAVQKVQLEARTLFQAERVAYLLLKDARWPTRTFRKIRHHIGGFDDEKLREILVRAGAVRFGRKGAGLYGPEGDANTERWGLVERNKERLQGANEQAPEADDLD
jgi:hypothetical protein